MPHCSHWERVPIILSYSENRCRVKREPQTLCTWQDPCCPCQPLRLTIPASQRITGYGDLCSAYGPLQDARSPLAPSPLPVVGPRTSLYCQVLVGECIEGLGFGD